MRNRKRGILKQLLDTVNPYRWVIGTRNRMFDKGILESRSFDIATICIGNISVGGTGKTPHTEYLIELLRKNHSIAVLSRGYGRCSKGYIKADGSTPMTQIGDEPFQIKNKYPDIHVAVCEKRVTGIDRLTSKVKGIDVILLDDAYQHRYVNAGLKILLIDSNRPIWQDCVLPFGLLRESIAGIRRADIVVMTKCDGITEDEKAWCRNYIKGWKEIPVFFSRMRYGDCYPLFRSECKADGYGKAKEVLLVTGIAKPEPLRAELASRGAKVTLMQFGDHHNFSTADLDGIAARFEAIEEKDKVIVTTEKDATRLLQRTDLARNIRENIHVMPIKVEILGDEEEVFNKIVEEYVTENSGNSRISQE